MGRGPELIRALTEREQLCINCTLTECDEKAPGCLWRTKHVPVQRKPRRWGWFLDRVCQLEPGAIDCVSFDRVCDLELCQFSLYHHIKRGHVPEVRTWRSYDPGGPYYLYFELT